MYLKVIEDYFLVKLRYEDILTILDQTLFSVLGHHLGCDSKPNFQSKNHVVAQLALKAQIKLVLATVREMGRSTSKRLYICIKAHIYKEKM